MTPPPQTDAARLLAALRAAGSDVFVEDDQFFASPPARRVEWPVDLEEALETHHLELRDLVLAEIKRRLDKLAELSMLLAQMKRLLDDLTPDDINGLVESYRRELSWIEQRR